MLILARTVVLSWVLALVACSGEHRPGNRNAGADSDVVSLPQPEATGGSITGMPATPGPGQVGLHANDALASIMPVPGDGDGVATGNDMPPGDAGLPAPGEAPPMPDTTLPGEPTSQDAVAVLRDYYSAIGARDYAHAFALWAGGGRSGQTLQQFADGFADTANVSVQIHAPGRVDAAAGSRYVEVPVTVTTAQRDGSVRRYAGMYTLQRAVADGANAEQRVWRISSAQIHEAGQ